MTNQPRRRSVPNLVEVKAITDVTPELRRITFYGKALHDYPKACIAGHLKIFLPHLGQEKPDLPTQSEQGPIWAENAIKPIMRSYTVRYLRPEAGEIDIEFVLHGDSGPASRFALNAQPGQYIAIGQPGGPCLQTIEQNYYIAGDNTALPAIASLLESMPKNSQGHVFILLANKSGKISFTKPENVNIHWFIGDDKPQTEELIKAFKQYNLPADNVYFWLAGENNLVVQLRNYLRKDCGYTREQIYAVPYWRKGVTEDQYHNERHKVMDED